MKITTWNINGIRARIEGAVAYVREARPDVLCLQEIKTVDEGFPTEAFTDLGYNVATHGQKGFNGVALLALHPLDAPDEMRPGPTLVFAGIALGKGAGSSARQRHDHAAHAALSCSISATRRSASLRSQSLTLSPSVAAIS